MNYRNISFATVGGLQDLLSDGVLLEVRGSKARELRNRITVLENPQERCLFVPDRRNDVIASVAETLWVIAGRDDIGWLQSYLPRARDYSDDGNTWRGAYGPRLRNWNGIDQLAQIRRLLLDEAATRRAVMSLYDPDRDFVDSKDIPCNNWLHWLVRDGRLHLTVAVRSNDIVWGFSGVNSFEWSLLQQMMAFWIGAGIGDTTYLATSLHLYEHHEIRARRMVEQFQGVTCYDHGLTAPQFNTPFDQIDSALAVWFELESEVRKEPNRLRNIDGNFSDPFLTVALQLVRLHHGVRSGWSDARLVDELAELPICDLTAAVYEFYGRRFPLVLTSIPNPQIAAFLSAYRAPREPALTKDPSLVETIKHLHFRKDAAYGTAWKKRGEVTSVLCNVARKVDRLERYLNTGEELADEGGVDTAIDLFVYLIKYQLLLLEDLPNCENHRLSEHLRPFSENIEAFNLTVDKYKIRETQPQSTGQAISRIVASFGRLHAIVERGTAPLPEKLDCVVALSDQAFELVSALASKKFTLIHNTQ